MSYSETAIGTKTRREPESPGQALGADVERLLDESRRVLEGHLDRILSQLARPCARIDIARLRGMLLALSADIRSRTHVLHDSDYRWVLRQITGIYAQGLGRRPKEPYTITAAAYAQVIETISQAYPAQDYCEAVGQLVGYMVRLFQTQENSWRRVFEHILSIPDAVEAKQLLDRAFLVEIQEWAEAGVENLFSIRADLYEKIRGIQAKIAGLDLRIRVLQRALRVPSVPRRFGPNVVDLAQVRVRRRIAALLRSRQALEAERRAEESIVALIESDIREFEEKLRQTARAYYLRSV